MSARETIPGRPLLLGTTLALVTVVVVIPLAALVFSLHGVGAAAFANAVLAPRALAAFQLTFGAALAASIIDLVAGLFVAWILVRYRFPGRAALDALVDIPFALPPSVTGITLAMLYGVHGAFGGWLEAHGLHVAYTQLGLQKATLLPRTFSIATFALCGFANLGSIGMQIGGIGALVPNRRNDLARLGFRAMLAGTMANLMSASIVSMLIR